MKTSEKFVEEFSKLMLTELKNNEHKSDWRKWKNTPEINRELTYHLSKLQVAIDNKDKLKTSEHIGDCANILMFLGNSVGLFKGDLSYVHSRINLRSYWNTNDNRARDGIEFSDSEFNFESIKQPYYLKHTFFTKKDLFTAKF